MPSSISKLIMIGCSLLAALCTCSLVACAQGFDRDLAFDRAKHLQRGVNASLWFAQARDYSPERLRMFMTEDDIALIENLGFDHIRLSVDAAPLLQGGLSRKDDGSPFLTELDRVVTTILRHHLSVIVDVHPESAYKANLRNGDEPVERFSMLWSSLAGHFATYDSEHVFFEIMNEPEQTDLYRWIGIEARVADAIRKAAPAHTILATGAKWSGLSDLLQTQPLALNNVIYTFHDYEPFAFTHQGATWTDPHVQSLRKIPYPSDPDAVTANLDQSTSIAGAYFVEEYGLAHWNAERVDRTIAFAKRWADMHHVPVYCGEFGVLRDFVNPDMRAAWMHDMAVALRKNDIGWAMWDYQANFGIVHKESGKTIPDRQIVEALGLKQITE